MSRTVAIKYPPRRSTCPTCKAQVFRIYTGNAGAILVERDGNKPIAQKPAVHHCVSEPRR